MKTKQMTAVATTFLVVSGCSSGTSSTTAESSAPVSAVVTLQNGTTTTSAPSITASTSTSSESASDSYYFCRGIWFPDGTAAFVSVGPLDYSTAGFKATVKAALTDAAGGGDDVINVYDDQEIAKAACMGTMASGRGDSASGRERTKEQNRHLVARYERIYPPQIEWFPETSSPWQDYEVWQPGG